MNALVVTRGASEIQARWRGPLGLVPDDPADPAGQWHGPCLRCAKPRKLSVRPGDIRPVVWRSHCPDHPDEAVYAALKYLVPTAPPPGKPKRPVPLGNSRVTRIKAPGELAPLEASVLALALNDGFARSAPIRLALLEVLGYDTDEALDALGVTDVTTRRRTRQARSKVLSPAKSGVSATKRRSEAGTLLPAESGVNAFSLQLAEQPLTSTFVCLTDRATLVLAGQGNGHHTDTDTALDLVTSLLGAEVISTEPRPSPLPVSGTVDAWQLADEGPCHRCGTRTCVYGPVGNPLCADCRPAGLVSTTGR